MTEEKMTRAIRSALGLFKTELKAELIDPLRADLEAKIDQSAQALQAEFHQANEQLRVELRQANEQLRAELRQALDEQASDIVASIINGALHPFMDMVSADRERFDGRIGRLEERVDEVEGRVGGLERRMVHVEDELGGSKTSSKSAGKDLSEGASPR